MKRAAAKMGRTAAGIVGSWLDLFSPQEQDSLRNRNQGHGTQDRERNRIPEPKIAARQKHSVQNRGEKPCRHDQPLKNTTARLPQDYRRNPPQNHEDQQQVQDHEKLYPSGKVEQLPLVPVGRIDLMRDQQRGVYEIKSGSRIHDFCHTMMPCAWRYSVVPRAGITPILRGNDT